MNPRSFGIVSAMHPLVLDGQPLTLSEVETVARNGRTVEIGRTALNNLKASREVVEQSLQSGLPVYGINTGFGSLSRVRIAPDQLRQVQRNLVRSHAAGVGEPLGDDVVRAMLLILAA